MLDSVTRNAWVKRRAANAQCCVKATRHKNTKAVATRNAIKNDEAQMRFTMCNARVICPLNTQTFSYTTVHVRTGNMPKVNTDNILGKAPGARTVDQDYHFGKVLGKGAFGVVRSATSRANGEKFACKSIAKSKLVCREDVQDVQREVAIMNHVAGHPNVVNSKVQLTACVTSYAFNLEPSMLSCRNEV